MAVVPVTDALAAAARDNAVLAAPTDESLNAGAFLPDEPISDGLTTEIEGDAAVIMEMLPKLNEESTVVTESIFNDLQYLHSDLLHQRGMNQRIAQEAIALIPSFGGGLPVNFYSRHASDTGYKASLEEIETSMKSDLLMQLSGQINRLDSIAAQMTENANHDVLETLDFARRAQQISIQGDLLDEFAETAIAAGFQWDDATFRGCAVDPSQNAVVASILTIDQKIPFSFAAMDAYYAAHFDAPAMIENMTSYLGRWKGNIEAFLQQAQADNGKATLEVPTEPSIYFNAGNKTTPICNAADVFYSAEDAIKPAPTGTDFRTVSLVKGIGNAALQAKVEDILVRLKSFTAMAGETSAAVKQLCDFITQDNTKAESFKGIDKAVKALDEVITGLTKTYNVLTKWCINAGIATSYAGMLASKVTEFAWTAINQCRETMQMRESIYLNLKTLVEDIQAPVKTNAV